jgi:hypothetical protein
MCYCGNDESLGFCYSGVCKDARAALEKMTAPPAPVSLEGVEDALASVAAAGLLDAELILRAKVESLEAANLNLQDENDTLKVQKAGGWPNSNKDLVRRAEAAEAQLRSQEGGREWILKARTDGQIQVMAGQAFGPLERVHVREIPEAGASQEGREA